MKTIIITSALFVALSAATGATAQIKSAPAPSAPDSVLLSQSQEGNYLVRRYLVKHLSDSDYSIRYQINISKLITSLDGNSVELADLNKFVEHLMADSLQNVKWVEIVGYASPDGPTKFNLELAKNRAMDFKNYVDSKYGFSKHFEVKTAWNIDSWASIRERVTNSAIPSKAQVLDIIDGAKWNESQKEAALRRLPSSWNYLRKSLLPSLRKVEMTINYGQGMIVEQRMMLPKPAPVPVKVVEPCCVVDDAATGLIIITEEPNRDFDKLSKIEQKAARREARLAEKLAKKEERLAVKMAVKAEKMARKIAKDEAKAARKAAKLIDRM